MGKARVLIIEDEPLIAEDIKETLEEMGFVISGMAYDSDEALSALRDTAPDVALLDINLNSEMDGIEIAQVINSEYHIPFVYLTSYADKATIERAKHTRPYGYVVKPFDENDLFTSLEIALFNHANRQAPIQLTLERLNRNLLSKITKREFEILLDVHQGLSNQQLAEKHFVSLNTIKTHVKRIYDKLDVNNRIGVIKRIRNLVA